MPVLTTKGLTEKDFALARGCNGVFAKFLDAAINSDK